MMTFVVSAAPPQDRIEAWLWVLMLVVVLIMVMLVLAVVRRRLVRPMPRRPTDTTDAWKEAGRRLAVPPPADDTGGSDELEDHG